MEITEYNIAILVCHWTFAGKEWAEPRAGSNPRGNQPTSRPNDPVWSPRP